MPLQAGDIIEGRYQVQRLLGQGGLGLVYQALQWSTQQTVAIKVIQPHASPRPDHAQMLRDRFTREMRLVGQLRHPNIVRLIDAGTTSDDELFSVFEFVKGDELAAVLKGEGALSIRETVRLMTQVLEALSAAHDQGIVHRDLKPQNIMITSAGSRRSAVVLDFGIATVVEDARGQDYKSLTSQGHIPGTPWYMAPEQFEGLVTPQTDLYAWGLVTLECLTGQQAISAETPFQAMIWQASKDPLDIPSALRQHPVGRVIQRAISKDLSARYLTAAQVLRDLECCPPDDLPALRSSVNDPIRSATSNIVSFDGFTSPSVARPQDANTSPNAPKATSPEASADTAAETPLLASSGLNDAFAPTRSLAPVRAASALATLFPPTPPETAPPASASPTSPQPRTLSQFLPWIAIAVIGIGLFAVAGALWLRSPPSTPPPTAPPTTAPPPTNPPAPLIEPPPDSSALESTFMLTFMLVETMVVAIEASSAWLFPSLDPSSDYLSLTYNLSQVLNFQDAACVNLAHDADKRICALCLKLGEAPLSIPMIAGPSCDDLNAHLANTQRAFRSDYANIIQDLKNPTPDREWLLSYCDAITAPARFHFPTQCDQYPDSGAWLKQLQTDGLFGDPATSGTTLLPIPDQDDTFLLWNNHDLAQIEALEATTTPPLSTRLAANIEQFCTSAALLIDPNTATFDCTFNSTNLDAFLTDYKDLVFTSFDILEHLAPSKATALADLCILYMTQQEVRTPLCASDPAVVKYYNMIFED